MFTLSDDKQLVLSATDLTNHLACPHLTQVKLAIARGERKKARKSESAHADLLRQRGDEHEIEQLAVLSAACGGHVDLKREGFPSTRRELEARAADTEQAMRDGAPLIYQAHFFDGTWQGNTDFLRRKDGVESSLGNYAYEVMDTKLSRQVKPSVVHQLAVYSRLVARVQGTELPLAYVVLGNGETETVDLTKYSALHRRVVRRFEAVVAAPGVDTYPEPVAHCPICSLAQECSTRLRADDHLSLVARARRNQRQQLVELGLPTVAALAGVAADVDSGALGPERFGLLRNQAGLQVRSRESGLPTHDHLPPARAAGYARLPEPSAGDIFFDLEGDPYVGKDGGIEYLWGWSTPGAEGPYDCVWAHDEVGEKHAMEAFIDHVVAERRRHPGLHVFHYAPHERSKLTSLSVKYATREAEVDQLLRSGVLVDLYAVVAQALQVGEESYSLKKLERHHDFKRLETSVREGGGSIVAYEGFLETGDEALLESIRAYNEEDCRSTESLRDWLQNVLLPEAEAEFGVSFEELREPEPEEEQGDPEWVAGVLELVARLHAGLPELAVGDDPDQAERRLIGNLLMYYRREQKPEWWRYFELRAMSSVDLVEEREALGCLTLDASVEPVAVKSSLEYTLTCPPQDFKEPMGTIDPETGKSVNLVSFDPATCRAVIRRGKSRADEPLPTSLVPGAPVDATALRHALEQYAESLLAGDGRFGAVRALLLRESPRLSGGTQLGEQTDELIAAALALDESVLPIQGPPGTGKTYNAARMIVAALKAGKRVGVSAQSHAAIQNLLRATERHAAQVGFSFAGGYKGDPLAYESAEGFITVADDNKPIENGDYQLVAGTAWFFSRKPHREDGPAFDLIFIDEAGQFALASAAAIGVAAKSLILLGDPQQLPQVTQADHPDGSGASVLEHVLNGHATIPPDRGVLLTESWRMHPEICRFVSEQSYEGRLHSTADCGLRRVESERASGWRGGTFYCEGVGSSGGNGGSLSTRVEVPVPLTGAGLRTIEVEHHGNSQSSREEAQAIALACEALLDDDGVVTEPERDAPPGSPVPIDGMVTRSLRTQDILVVAPYNLAVQAIAAQVPPGVKVGTVDKIQGQEAAVVFYALTCSSAEDVPRGLDFLFDPNRFNVAVSRAQCLAVLVHSPRLLDAECRTLGVMARVDGVCRFEDVAKGR